jgi:hypothetical protein
MTETQRNFLILGAICVVVVAAGSAGGAAVGSVGGIVNLLFLVVGVIAYVQWRTRNADTISRMRIQDRLLVDGGTAGLVVGYVTARIYPGWSVGHGAGMSLAFILLMCACGYAIYLGWQGRDRGRWGKNGRPW